MINCVNVNQASSKHMQDLHNLLKTYEQSAVEYFIEGD